MSTTVPTSVIVHKVKNYPMPDGLAKVIQRNVPVCDVGAATLAHAVHNWYASKAKRIPIGMLVVVETPTTIGVGWSLCHRKDVFNRTVGHDLATARAAALANGYMCATQPVPHELKADMAHLVERLRRSAGCKIIRHG